MRSRRSSCRSAARPRSTSPRWSSPIPPCRRARICSTGSASTGRARSATANAGANNDAGFNRNFATNAGNLTDTAARRFDPGMPGDGGFDAEPEFEVPGVAASFLGNGTMNTAPLVEAADTGPFFHNNSARDDRGRGPLLHHDDVLGRRSVPAQRRAGRPARGVPARAQRAGEHPEQQGLFGAGAREVPLRSRQTLALVLAERGTRSRC